MSEDRSGASRDFLAKEQVHSQWESDYLNSDLDRFYDLAFDEILKRLNVRAGQSILDAGCGYCYHTARLARGPAQITAVDFSEAALGAARANLKAASLTDRVSLMQADLTNLPFENNSFDAVVCWGVLMHIPNIEGALRELARVLKLGGTLVLCENNAASLDVRIRERAISLVKRALNRPMARVEYGPWGKEEWTDHADGGLMVRKTNMQTLSRFLGACGLQETFRIAGQFTEAYTNVPTRWLKRRIYSANELYFKYVGSPSLAMGNIIGFQKDALDLMAFLDRSGVPSNITC